VHNLHQDKKTILQDQTHQIKTLKFGAD
jgi:hypothetical protein